MRLSFVQTIALALSSISLTLAFDDLSIPSTVAANTDVKLQITNDLSEGSSSFDAMFDSFRVYLSISAPGSGSYPSCFLINSSAIATTDLSFQIPASVGPDADSYSIVTMEFNQSPYADGPSGYEYSSDFTFTGGKGSWTAAELAGEEVGIADNLPCTAYDCARNCTQTFYPANVNSTDAYKSTYECTAACPGVTYVSWEELEAENGTEAGSSPSGSVTGVGTQSTTTSGTASSSPKATTTASSTGASHTASATGKSSSVSTSTTSTLSAATPSQSKSAGSQISATSFTLLSIILFGPFVALKY